MLGFVWFVKKSCYFSLASCLFWSLFCWLGELRLLAEDLLLSPDLSGWDAADIRRLISDLATQNLKLKRAVAQSTALIQVTQQKILYGREICSGVSFVILRFFLLRYICYKFCLCTNQNIGSESGRETDSYNKLKLPILFLYANCWAEMRKIVNFFIWKNIHIDPSPSWNFRF
jgi:hypothetical protein